MTLKDMLKEGQRGRGAGGLELTDSAADAGRKPRSEPDEHAGTRDTQAGRVSSACRGRLCSIHPLPPWAKHPVFQEKQGILTLM